MIYLMWGIYSLIVALLLVGLKTSYVFYGWKDIKKHLGWKIVFGPFTIVLFAWVVIWATIYNQPGWGLLFLPCWAMFVVGTNYNTYYSPALEAAIRLVQISKQDREGI